MAALFSIARGMPIRLRLQKIASVASKVTLSPFAVNYSMAQYGDLELFLFTLASFHA